MNPTPRNTDEPALTDWLDGQQHPAHEGVYQRDAGDVAFACWDGSRWHADAATAEAAVTRDEISPQQALRWRGLATPSSLPCATCRGHGVLDRGFDEESERDLIDECPDC
ncbi:MAG: hypothetical protein JWP52_1022 [Rhizobacter sp.]|nr:hypothetical protein [Rhizobacter sp.]